VKAVCRPLIPGCIEKVVFIGRPTTPVDEPGGAMPIVGRCVA
jgi:hypothetical protein